ncbi:ligand-dependent corepressor isoform X2 [Hyla sarda]|uniref:ligand-dependent corepressor isoform X2 n=1 Tax=Hyla sarda TaxID=327740 RepID=UPI0024C3B91B|nr:ligand-dependent corepressor isoform X2 [Hyla sarda]
MASLCKSQQCSIERRGFRQELDAWRHKLIHCVGFETILEGLFGPALLNDLSLFKDCEPTGVCDWSFDENCLFCCLRREKVKEHLAGFHKPINEPGHENFLKQEQAKIIRLERQAEEFINAVFYKKDSPRISDPNIPLVARQIMQRMIRQFAAEYTSKNSSTQDSSRPNSTKNQSLPKSPSGQSSPSPATTQNPVLSKLLMADQDSPLDLTVKKPHLEEPCEQDGVLDLSTKKSPCSGSPNSSISPSTSNTIGNGTQDTERKAIDPNNSTNLSLETFMAKLCSHHQKQFILVLNNLCTEESIMKSRSRSASVSEIENANLEDHDHSSCENNANLSPVKKDTSFPEFCLSTPTNVCEDSCPCEMSHCSNYLSKVPCSFESKADHAINVSYATDQTITNNPVGIPSTEEKSETTIAKVSEVSQTIFFEHCVLSHSNCTLNMHNDSPGSELPTDIPKIENKENTQYVNPKQAFLDCNDCILKQEHSVTTVTAKKLGNLCESPFHNLTDHSGSTLQKVKLHENKLLKTVKCKNSRVLVTNDCDKQCDVVYISEPITTECHFENHKSVVCARNTARKSTRGYLISGDCCELSTVRTLVRSSKVEEKGNSSLHISEALIIPNDLIKTLPSSDVLSLIHVEESVETDSDNPVPQNAEMKDLIPDSFRCIEPEKNIQCLALNKESVDNVSDSLIAVFSLTQDEPKKLHVPSNHTANEQALNENDDEIPKMKQISSVVNIDAQSLSVNDHEKSITELAIDPDFYISRSNNSCSQDGSGTQSLDMEITVSLNDNHTVPRTYPNNTAIEEASATLKYIHESPSTAYPSTLGTADKDIPVIGSSSLNDFKILPEDSSETVIADPVTSDQPLSMQISSKTISDILPVDNSEGQISKSSQIDPSSSGSVNEFPKHFVQCVVKENAHLMMDSNIENVKDCQSLVLNDSFEMEAEENVLPENINALWPTKCFQSPLNISAKIVENNNARLEANVSEETHHCDTVSSSGCSKYDTVNDALKTKEVIGENNTDAVNSNKIDNLLTSNRTSCKHLTPFKRHKKVPVPTDRCLRSRESHDDSVLHNIPSLQVLLSYVQGTNLAQRSVVLKTEDTPCSDTVISSVDDTSYDESYFAFFLNSHCREGKPLFYERILKSTCFKMPENLTVCLKIGSDKRIIYFTKEHHNCLNMADAKCKCDATSVKNTSQLEKCNESESENATNYGSPTKSSTPHIAVNSLKDKMKCCKSGKLKNLSPRNEKINSSNKRRNRPKFIDWCSEEENQERISNFNDKYTSVHKNWVSLEKETVNVNKSKSKSDRLKEIWKTKKRIRRPKSSQDTPKCSPMQLLFMNSFKFSDVCEWFMETTETKSLVIVKKLNTRIPEEHQLPMIQSPKYSSQSLYPHMLQAQRLKKHLKKFASVTPAQNNIKTENSLNTLVSNSSELVHEVTDTVKGPNDCKKQEPHAKAKKTAPVHILKKNRSQENVNSQSYPVNKNKVCMANVKRKASNSDNKKAVSSSDLSLRKSPKALTSKSLIVKKCKKRNKSDCLEESVAQPNKKRKIEAKQRFLKNGPHVHKKAAPTKSKVRKMSKIHSTSSSQAPKKQVGKAGVFKTTVIKGKAKTRMQKQSLKSQIVLKHQTRSAKLSQASSKVSDSPKITSFSSSHRKKERCKKISTVSTKNKRNVASRVRHNKQRSQLEPPTRKGRSLEFK